MERAAAELAAFGAEEAPHSERAEVAVSGLGAVAVSGLGAVAAQQGPKAREGAVLGFSREEGKEEVPLRLQLSRGRRRAGPGTPAPSWKLEPSLGPQEGAAADASAAPGMAAARRSSASARQLGASLWEIHDVMREKGRRSGARRHRSGRGLADVGVVVDQPLSSDAFDRNLADSLNYYKLHQERSHASQPFSPASYTSSIGNSSINQAVSPARSFILRHRSRGAGYYLNTSTELLKVLNRIWNLEEQHTDNMSVVKGLKMELQQAQARIQELIQERRAYRHKVASLIRQLSEDKAVQEKDRWKVEGAVCSVQDELENERQFRCQYEDLHQKFGKEVSVIKSAFMKSVKDLEKEKKTNRLLEDLCDQFAIGIRNYEEEVSMLKRRHANDYEHKFDKFALHISEAWLDERLQMQNMDVQEGLMHKTTVTERLSCEIQAFVVAKKLDSCKQNIKYLNDSRQDASLRRQSLESVHFNGATSAPQLAENGDNESVASDVHCFELDMHGDGIQNQDHLGPHRSVPCSIDAPRIISEYSRRTAGESSHRSHVLPYSHKYKARSSSSKPQHATRTPDINSHNSAGILKEEQNGITYSHVSRGSHIDSSMHRLEARHTDCLGQESFDHYSRTSLFCEGTTSGDLCNLHSPVRQLNYHTTPLGHEIFECSAHMVVVKENTLKAKLLQARLEGRHARLKASGGSISSRRK